MPRGFSESTRLASRLLEIARSPELASYISEYRSVVAAINTVLTPFDLHMFHLTYQGSIGAMSLEQRFSTSVSRNPRVPRRVAQGSAQENFVELVGSAPIFQPNARVRESSRSQKRKKASCSSSMAFHRYSMRVKNIANLQ